jgi:DNA repair protein RadA/Sms
MAKVKRAFFCKNCGYEAPKWMGKCPSCNEWNTFTEELILSSKEPTGHRSKKSNRKPTLVQTIEVKKETRIKLADQELNRVLGGGLVPGSLILFGGEPGIGKSTLMLQMALSHPSLKTLYVSGEESEQQLKMRAERIGYNNPQCYVLAETDIESVFKQIENLNPDLVLIDSIQALYSPLMDSTPGSVSQTRECAGQLMRFAKTTQTPVILIGHITKDGSLAGPKVLEHMVDTVLQFEGDRNFVYRLLRTVKNRFGATNELGVYEMVQEGLREVANPSKILISENRDDLSGVAIAPILEGIRPVLIEVQALVSSAVYGTPQRTSTGFDLRRLNMLLAVLEKRAGFRLAAKDVFLNLTGGIKVEDPGLDLAVAAAILSSNEDIALAPLTCLAGEIGLSGEIRPVSRIDQRILEAEKLGFERIIVSSFNKGLSKKRYTIGIVTVSTIEDTISALFA